MAGTWRKWTRYFLIAKISSKSSRQLGRCQRGELLMKLSWEEKCCPIILRVVVLSPRLTSREGYLSVLKIFRRRYIRYIGWFVIRTLVISDIYVEETN